MLVRLCGSVAIVLAFLAPVLGAQPPELRIKPGPPQEGQRSFAERAKIEAAWLQRVVGKPFAERAKGQPWETEAKQFVAQALAHWTQGSPYEDDADLAAEGARLRHDRKCDDPLVRCLAARLAARATYDEYWRWIEISDHSGLRAKGIEGPEKEVENTLKDLESIHTPAGFLSVVALEGAWVRNNINQNDAAHDLRKRAVKWMVKSLEDGSYEIPGPDEELFVKYALGEPYRRSTTFWGEEMSRAVEQSALSDWAKAAMRGGILWGDGTDLKDHGDFQKGEPLVQQGLQAFAKSWQLHPSAPEPAQMVYRNSWGRETPGGDSSQAWFDRVVGAEFDWVEPYQRTIAWMRPDWTGSAEELTAFGRACVATHRFDTATPLFFMDGLRILTMGVHWREVCRPPENGAALLELGQGMASEPSRRGQEKLWRSLLAVWAWLGGNDREAQEALDALHGELHPVALRELTFFNTTFDEMKGELAIRMSEARSAYEEGEKDTAAGDYAGAQTAYAAALAKAPENSAAKALIGQRIAVNDFELAYDKGDWVKLPLDVHLWQVAVGKWRNEPDGALILDGENFTVHARFQGLVGANFELRGKYSFHIPEGVNAASELGIAFRCYGDWHFLTCSTWRSDDARVSVGLRQGIWNMLASSALPVIPREREAPYRDVNEFHLTTDAEHMTFELNGTKIWDNVTNKLFKRAIEAGQVGFAARAPGGGAKTTIRDVEIRKMNGG